MASGSVFAGACELSSKDLAKLPVVKVQTVYDGDTVLLSDGRKVRFIGVNTPEVKREDRPAEPMANQATKWLKQWQGKKIRLLTGAEAKDRYKRQLAHPFTLEGSSLTADLLGLGMGFPVAIPPNVKFADCYAEQAEKAKLARLGVWKEPYYRLRTTSMASDLKGGFARYRGKIERIYVSKKVIWVDLFGEVSLRVARKDQAFLDGEVLSRLLKAVDDESVLKLPPLEFSGWLMDRSRWGKKMLKKIQSGKRKRWQMNIRHRNHWALSS